MYLIFIGFVSFGAIVQIPGIGGGVQVVAVLVLTKIFGVPVELATSVAVLIWLVTFVVIVPFGLVAALHEGLSWRKLRDLEREASAMNCPFCGHLHDKVVDSRESKEGDAIRRRRQCLACERRFTTYERIDEVPYMVIKKDGRREKFDRQKVLGGLAEGLRKTAGQHGAALGAGGSGGSQGD